MVKKIDIESKKYILMYSVLGHPMMIFKAFETRSGALKYIKEQENVSKFTIMNNDYMVDVIKNKEVMGW